MAGNGGAETEVKIAMPDVASAAAMVERAGLKVSKPRVFEANAVYDTPNAELRAKGALLRLRQVGDINFLTHKGPPVPGKHKSRPETEITVSDFAACDRIFSELGYAVTFRYEKFRTEYSRPGYEGVLTLDETPIGVFLEIEGSADFIDSTAALLGIDEKQYILQSYGALYLEHCRRNNLPPSHMIFS